MMMMMMMTNLLQNRLPVHLNRRDVDSSSHASSCLSSFNETTSVFGLHTSWSRTKIQNLGSSPEPSRITVDGNPVDAVSTFVYLGSLQSSDGYCTTDIRRRISLAALVMSSLDSIWKDRRLSTLIKIRTHLTLVQ